MYVTFHSKKNLLSLTQKKKKKGSLIPFPHGSLPHLPPIRMDNIEINTRPVLLPAKKSRQPRFRRQHERHIPPREPVRLHAVRLGPDLEQQRVDAAAALALGELALEHPVRDFLPSGHIGGLEAVEDPLGGQAPGSDVDGEREGVGKSPDDGGVLKVFAVGGPVVVGQEAEVAGVSIRVDRWWWFDGVVGGGWGLDQNRCPVVVAD